MGITDDISVFRAMHTVCTIHSFRVFSLFFVSYTLECFLYAWDTSILSFVLRILWLYFLNLDVTSTTNLIAYSPTTYYRFLDKLCLFNHENLQNSETSMMIKIDSS